MITHDLGIIAEVCDRVGVMYAGTIVELGSVETILPDPLHPYTIGLIECDPEANHKEGVRLDTIPGLCAEPHLSRRRAAGSTRGAVKPWTYARGKSRRSTSGEREPATFVACHLYD